MGLTVMLLAPSSLAIRSWSAEQKPNLSSPQPPSPHPTPNRLSLVCAERRAVGKIVCAYVRTRARAPSAFVVGGWVRWSVSAHTRAIGQQVGRGEAG